MIIKCPECGTENQTTQTPQPGKRYRCGKCGALITFPQTTDIPDTTTETLQEKTRPEKQKIESDRTYSSSKTRKWLTILGTIAGVLIAVSLTMTVLAGNRITAAQEDGSNKGQAQGYSDGYEQGKSAGYDAGNEKGYSEGDAEGYENGLTVGYEEGKVEGYNQGYSEGHEEGERIGYTAGKKEGYNSGEIDGYEAGKEEGYTDGYFTGFKEGIGTDYLVRNPTYSEVIEELGQLELTSAWQIDNYFEAKRIRTGFVWVNIASGGGAGYSLVAFETVDEGLIIINPLSYEEIEPEVGKRLSELLGWSTPDFDDTITRIKIAW